MRETTPGTTGPAGGWLARVSPAVAGGMALLPLVVVIVPDRLPLVVALALLSLVVLSAVYPSRGLLVLAVVAPLGDWATRVVDVSSFRLTEALVLAVLGGAFGHAAWAGPTVGYADRRHVISPLVATAARVMVVVTAASFAVRVGVSQVGLQSYWLGVVTVWDAVTTDYLFGPSGAVPGLGDAARLLESVGLLLLVIAWCTRHQALPIQLARATVVAGVGAIAVNLTSMTEAVVGDPNPFGLLGRFLAGRSLAAHISDINATGSYFLMVAILGAGVAAVETGRRRHGFAAATGLALAGLWLAGSRTALATALLAAFAGGGAWMLARGPRVRRRVLTVGALVLIVAAVVIPTAMTSWYSDRTAPTASVDIRMQFLETSLRMLETRPLFGVGIGRYYQLSGEFMPAHLRAVYQSENAHNNYMQITAELGLVGIAAFLLLLGAGARTVWRGLARRRFDDPVLLAAAGGVAAFLVTCVAGHPLLVNETAFPFWIVSAVAVARASTVPRDGPANRTHRRPPATIWVVVVVLAVSVPWRVDAELRERGPEELDSGLYGWEVEMPAVRRFRWSSGHATLFVPADVLQVRLPVRALHAEPGARPVRVEVSVGGQVFRDITLPDPRWVDIHIPLERPAMRYHRIGLRVVPTWSPARTYGTADGRILGVKVGEPMNSRRRD